MLPFFAIQAGALASLSHRRPGCALAGDEPILHLCGRNASCCSDRHDCCPVLGFVAHNGKPLDLGAARLSRIALLVESWCWPRRSPTLKGGDLGLVFLDEIGSLGVIVEGPGLVLATQIRIRLRDTSCRLASAWRLSPATYSCATCRLNSMLWERCLVMAFIL